MVPTAYDIKCPGRLGSDSTDVCVPSEVLAISVDHRAVLFTGESIEAPKCRERQ